MFRTLASVTILLGLVGGPAFADDDVIRDRIALSAAKPSVTVKGSIKGYTSHEYMVSANAGQTLSVRLDAQNKSTYFNVWSPGKKPGQDEALFIGDVSGDVFSQKLAETGDYLVQVYLSLSQCGAP